jgi:uncharacterized protein (DUF58 family)
MSGTGTRLLEQETLQRLERLSLAVSRRIRGTMQGKRRSKDMGSSLEFADYRLYTPGDDTRQLDWNAYARTGKPFVKLFMDEQEIEVNLYIDASASMGFGGDTSASGASKFDYSKQLAASVGYVALAGYDRVGVRFFDNRITDRLPPLRGKGSVHKLMQFLQAAACRASGDLSSAIMSPLAVPKRRGVCWLFSDFLYESGMQEALTYLLSSGQDVIVVQVLSPEEIHPALAGDLRLLDSETFGGKEVAMSAKVLKAYEAELERFTRGLQRFCHERGIAYALAVTNTPVEEAVHRTFRSLGLLV